MRDFNFFEAFEQKKKRSDGPRVGYPLVLILVILAAAAWPAYNFYQIYRLDQDIVAKRNQLEADERYPLFLEAELKEAELANARSILTDMQMSSEIIQEKEIIDESLLYTIASSMPEDTALDSMTINGENIALQGNAQSKPAIAEFEYNIRQTGRFENIFIPSISEEDGLWRFMMMFRVLGGEDQ